VRGSAIERIIACIAKLDRFIALGGLGTEFQAAFSHGRARTLRENHTSKQAFQPTSVSVANCDAMR
jgi:hypothetical protein